MSKFKRKHLGDPETHLHDLFIRPFLTKRDKEVLLSLYWHRCLTSHQVREIHFAGPNQAEVICRRRLRTMFDNLLIDRFFVDVGEGNGSSPQHVMLDVLGAKMVAGMLNLKMEELKWTKEHNDAALPYLKHTVELNAYYVQQLQRAREMGHEIPFFQAEHHLLKSFEHRGRTYTFNPDAYFQMWKGEEGIGVFLEWDRGTMSRKQFQEKQHRYRAFYDSGEFYQEGYEVMPIILTVAPTWERCIQLKECIEQVDRTDLRWAFAPPEVDIWDEPVLEAHKEKTVPLFE